jgi:hypothetical protein
MLLEQKGSPSMNVQHLAANATPGYYMIHKSDNDLAHKTKLSVDIAQYRSSPRHWGSMHYKLHITCP